MSDVSTPFGLRDIKLTPYLDAAGTILASESIDLPYARTLSFSETEEFQELRGDDRVVAQHGSGPVVDFDIESGGIPFEAYQAMAGGEYTTTGSPGETKRVFSKKVTDSRPWFRIEGQAISDSGGDVRCIIYKAKCTGELSGEFTDGEFFLTAGSGVGIGDVNGNLYDFVGSDVVTDFVEPNPAASVPVIQSVSPSEDGAEGDVALLFGKYFSGSTAATIGGVTVDDLTVHSDNNITFIIPAGTVGPAEIVVTNATGDSDAFDYVRA